MSSMAVSTIKIGLLFAGVSGLAVLTPPGQQTVATLATAMPALTPAPQEVVQAIPQASSDYAIGNAVTEWRRIRQSDNLPFSAYANFLLANPGWPGETGRRSAAETSLGSGAENPALVARFFGQFPPLTAAGKLRYAEALMATGRRNEAVTQARAAWTMGALRPQDEATLISFYGPSLTPADHDERMDALLWQGGTTAASRQLSYVSSARRPVFAARLAMRTRAPDAASLAASAEAMGRGDAGYIADRASWLRDTGNSIAARNYLAQPRSGLTHRPSDPEKWYEVLLANARGAANDRQYAVAYNIARQVDDAFPAGADISAMSLGIRDDYTSLTWLAGQMAHRHMGRPADAIGMYSRYGNGSRTAQTRSKGLYWAGRAAELAGQRDVAANYYRQASEYPQLFYGMLAMEQSGQPLRPPPPTPALNVAPNLRQAYFQQGVVRAAQYLGAQGDRRDQALFLRQIAADATSEADHALGIELSRMMGRPEMAVWVGKSALNNRLQQFVGAGFPTVPVPTQYASSWTMIHSIARQESEFDRGAVSHAGARGLMQLMPGTARDVARTLGMSYQPASLTSDTNYNIQLGSSYFQRRLDQNGNHVLALAAYNAGQGNMNKWLASNGDPRSGNVDMLNWIEDIPFFETKNYVQRVVENAVVYDLMNPTRAKSRGPYHVSWYLGRRPPR